MSGQDINLEAFGALKLLRIADESIARDFTVRGDSYWSPLDLSRGTTMELVVNPRMLKKGIIVGKVPNNTLQMKKDEVKILRFEMANLFWNDTIWGDWPHKTIFEIVPKGHYWLVFELDLSGKGVLLAKPEHRREPEGWVRVIDTNTIKSNRVEITVESKL